MITVTPIYAGLTAFLFLVLSWRVIIYRRTHNLGLGDGGNKSLLKRMRAHANCAEYAPISLILLLCLELQGAPGWALHAAGCAILLGRALHGYGFSISPPKLRLRVQGMAVTLIAIAGMALATLTLAVFS